MLVNDKINLEPIWEATLNVYHEFASLCQKHRLKFWAAYGTVLGAVRHKGFIPWDDDLDVMMPRSDYEMFLRIAVKELPAYLKVVTFRNTPEFSSNIFAKIQDAREDVINDVSVRSGLSLRGGIFLDVFPLDGYPNNRFRRFLYEAGRVFRRFAYYRIYRKSIKGCRPLVYRMLGNVVCKICNLDPHDKLAFLEFCERVSKRYAFETSDFVEWYAPDQGGLYRLVPRKILENETKVKFDDDVMPCPEDVDSYLRIEYGDYMTFPPENQRRITHASGAMCAWRLGPTTGRMPYLT